jgi:hypothetical protein
MVIMPSEEIFKNPFISVNSFGTELTPVAIIANDETQLKLIINPPPASADDFRKFRLLIDVFDLVIKVNFGVLGFWPVQCWNFILYPAMRMQQ